MFDYQVSKQSHFDNACRAFSNAHKGSLVQIAESIGMTPQMLRNKLNPEQPHMLTCVDLMKLTDVTEDASILDGLLEQLQCQPSVPVNEVCDANMPSYLLGATAEVGKLASEAVSGEHFNQTRVAEFKKTVNNAVRLLTLAGVTISSRLHSNPAYTTALDAFTGLSASIV
ncbi:phage regulatory CII family protein [Xenorhabdus griffiniae]|uniref:Phage regulatory CII family protein n=1 Tax=Xenorhabdus griffiniae TaxID=351672 RepID=A0ABY9XN73_9GAMM|nr:phage regulatory CII family protein [Xenorhabdus griffiniae]MBD1229372.1 phage regulatory CII family protein [Xenorhabdus griffiniae]MBE8589125.1 phage regulatory CII family protein [Xenorhabdus griffiniae]WMV74418.1 phage regulatory CII family protein [Xenorhabdus griffiniae]WNH04097.1 phage regulatory CII family protein [Xenorhabdus griffiniae]